MSLRFAIIKHIRTQVGDHWEDVVYELGEEKLKSEMFDHFQSFLPKKKWYQSLTSAELLSAFNQAWEKTVENFKRITLRIV
jgi:hypothetical protein